MMKLVLDFGNTLKKFALFEANRLIRLESADDIPDIELEAFTRDYLRENAQKPVRSAILSSVVDYPDSFREYLQKNYQLVLIDEKTSLPIRNSYKSKSSLGRDRLAIAVASHSLFPGNNVLAINAGTCLTYDFVSSSGEYLGGAISPGMNMRFRALNNLTAHLPLMDGSSFEGLIGRTTAESIISGVMNGIAAEVDGIINRYRENYENLTVILSGGDLNRFDKKLKNSIFASPYLVLTGLNIILDFNEKK